MIMKNLSRSRSQNVQQITLELKQTKINHVNSLLNMTVFFTMSALWTNPEVSHLGVPLKLEGKRNHCEGNGEIVI